jgi:hypothetical protein
MPAIGKSLRRQTNQFVAQFDRPKRLAASETRLPNAPQFGRKCDVNQSRFMKCESLQDFNVSEIDFGEPITKRKSRIANLGMAILVTPLSKNANREI